MERYLEKSGEALRGARLLLEAGDPGNACSLAYFAMYHAARAALLMVEAPVDTGRIKTHGGLISAFGQYVVLGGFASRDLSRIIGRTQNLRLIADYEAGPIEEAPAREAVELAELFVRAVEAIDVPRKVP